MKLRMSVGCGTSRQKGDAKKRLSFYYFQLLTKKANFYGNIKMLKDFFGASTHTRIINGHTKDAELMKVLEFQDYFSMKFQKNQLHLMKIHISIFL